MRRVRLKKKTTKPEVPEIVDKGLSREELTIKRYKDRINSPLSAIRAQCVECMGGSVHLITTCTSIDCSLHKLRMGKNVFDKRVARRLDGEKHAQRDKDVEAVNRRYHNRRVRTRN